MDQNSGPSGYGPGGQPPFRPPYAAPAQSDAPYGYEYRPPEAGAPRRRTRTALLAAGLCLALALVIGLAGLAVYLLGGGQLPLHAAGTGAGEDAPTFRIEEIPEEAGSGLSTTEIARKVSPSVVCVNIYVPQSLSVAASGSGIILNEEGFIVTNAHVVEGASAVSVMLDDGREFKAKIIGADARTDLAVIKIAAEDLTPAEFGDSGGLEVGERAVAIGNAAGELSGTVTQGIISGLDREVPMELSDGGTVTMTLVQTDAAINPGNSGGALVNRYGQVIGINSAKLNTAVFEGIGFAIPISDAQPVVENLIAYGYVKDRAVLGVSVTALSPANGPANGLPERGLYIAAIEDYSDLPNHGVAVGDVILKADGATLSSTGDLLDVVARHKPGDTMELEIQKQGSGDVVTIEVLLVASPS